MSIILNNQSVIFSNSLGEITSVNINNGSLLWQRSTENSKIYEDIMTLKTSDLILKENSIYFSNNKNKFYSIDFTTGITNWVQEINSNVKPAVIGNFIFTHAGIVPENVKDFKVGEVLEVSNVVNDMDTAGLSQIPIIKNMFLTKTCNGKIENVFKTNKTFFSDNLPGICSFLSNITKIA